MSNVKDMYVAGSMPFCLLDEAPDRLVKFMAMFSMPSWGLRIYYVSEFMVPNDDGGKTAFYNFAIKGQEAISWTALIGDLAEMQKAGAVFSVAIVADIETREASDVIPDISRAAA